MRNSLLHRDFLIEFVLSKKHRKQRGAPWGIKTLKFVRAAQMLDFKG